MHPDQGQQCLEAPSIGHAGFGVEVEICQNLAQRHTTMACPGILPGNPPRTTHCLTPNPAKPVHHREEMVPGLQIDVNRFTMKSFEIYIWPCWRIHHIPDNAGVAC